VETVLAYADGQTDMTKLIGAFRDYANAYGVKIAVYEANTYGDILQITMSKTIDTLSEKLWKAKMIILD
jgi:hypothetical protein